MTAPREARNPNVEIRNKHESPEPKIQNGSFEGRQRFDHLDFVLWIRFGFRASSFGLSYPNVFPFQPQLLAWNSWKVI